MISFIACKDSKNCIKTKRNNTFISLFNQKFKVFFLSTTPFLFINTAFLIHQYSFYYSSIQFLLLINIAYHHSVLAQRIPAFREMIISKNGNDAARKNVGN